MNYNNGISKNLSGNTSNQPAKFPTKNCFKINDKSRGTYKELKQLGKLQQLIQTQITPVKMLSLKIVHHLIAE